LRSTGRRQESTTSSAAATPALALLEYQLTAIVGTVGQVLPRLGADKGYAELGRDRYRLRVTGQAVKARRNIDRDPGRFMPVDAVDQILPFGIQFTLQADAEQTIDDDLSGYRLPLPLFETTPALLPQFGEMSRSIRLPCISSCTSTPCSRAHSATTKASPPLLPEPANTVIFSTAGQRASSARQTLRPARCINSISAKPSTDTAALSSW
jgi:hypothetical protein